jgi:hypothetical protein
VNLAAITVDTVSARSGHRPECATDALTQAARSGVPADQRVAWALNALACWGKSCGRGCLPGFGNLVKILDVLAETSPKEPTS